MHTTASYLSLAVFLLGLGLMLAEAMFFYYGLFAISGLLFFCLGLFILVQSGMISYELAWGIGMGAAISNLGLLAFALMLAWRARSKQQVSGIAYMCGQKAEVVQGISSGFVWVRLMGELWQASCSEQLQPGQQVQVLEVDGLMLKVKPVAN